MIAPGIFLDEQEKTLLLPLGGKDIKEFYHSLQTNCRY